MTDLSVVPPDIARDYWKRPLVVPSGGGKAIPYTRVTTLVGVLEDQYNLTRWKQRMTAIGITDRKDLRMAIAAHREDKTRLNEICEQALEAAEGTAAATMGTALHAITAQVDRGLDVKVPDEIRADVNAYVAATRELTALYIEHFSVQDVMKIGGTPDRIVKFQGKRYIADLKTGSIEWGYLSIAAQLALYSRMRPYDVKTGERLDSHGAELDRGIVIHAPAGTGTCTLYWVDLELGWELVRVAETIRKRRQLRFPQLMKELHATPAVPLSLEDQIKTATDAESVRALWRAHPAEWNEDLTILAKRHIAALDLQHAMTA